MSDKRFNIHFESTMMVDNIRSGSFEREYFSWDLVKEHEKQCQINHSQSVETLHNRGGLGWSELWFVLHDKEWEDPPDGKTWSEKDARDKCRKYEAAWLSMQEAVSLDDEDAEIYSDVFKIDADYVWHEVN